MPWDTCIGLLWIIMSGMKDIHLKQSLDYLELIAMEMMDSNNNSQISLDI